MLENHFGLGVFFEASGDRLQPKSAAHVQALEARHARRTERGATLPRESRAL